VSVREAAVDLLGKHISSSQDLALVYFDVLATAVRDPGTSVRKRAVNIMWESCIKQPCFPRATQACVHILTRATDPEESIQKLVTKVFHNLWFSPVGQGKASLPLVLLALPADCPVWSCHQRSVMNLAAIDLVVIGLLYLMVAGIQMSFLPRLRPSPARGYWLV
jgi:hypothetical protein